MKRLSSNFLVSAIALIGVVICLGASSSELLAQNEYVHGVWILNEGVQDWTTGEMIEQASVGVYDPALATFTEVAVFEGSSFTTNVVIAEGSAFIAADNKIVRFNLDTYAIEAVVDIQGVRQIAYNDGLIYVTRGDIDPVTWASAVFESYFVWYDATTLAWVGELPATIGIGYASEGITIVNDIVYIAINNGFEYLGEVGILGTYNVISGEYSEYDLGPDGKNPAHVKVTDTEVLLVNNTDWTATSLSRVELPELGAINSNITTTLVDGVSAGCNAALIMGEELVFQINGEANMRKVNTSNLNPSGTWGPGTDTYYRMAASPVDGVVYATVTNFFDIAEVQILSETGDLISAFQAGTIPGGIAFDVRSVLSVENVINSGENEIVGAFDIMGRVWSDNSRGLKIERLSNGTTSKNWVNH